MCIILLASFPSKLVLYLIEPNSVVIYSVALGFSILGIVVCLSGFRETLDIKSLAKRRLVIFDNFGLLIGSQNLNYSKLYNQS